ncbi:MAG: type I 3-dehydroquinate dehydratase [Planctomycetaceae bacterium]|nr:type I 3-dehydroquinate dehydratase [Planctomycetaceae bacterium]
MICVTVTPTSRTLAKVDLLNAARLGDVIELCLDHLEKEPDVKDLISTVNKPIIISCRRKEDGGQWEGTDEQRLMLLRQAIVAGPEYVELDLDIARKIPRFGTVQRVISFTRMDRPEYDIDQIFDEAAQHQADVVKFTWPTPTLDDAWPLLAAVSQKRRLPIVGMGLGRPEITFSLLGAKFGSPWIYAALERGMEAFPGQATVFELDEVYHHREIDKKTGFVAIAGFGEAQTATIRILNAAFQELEMNVRCLPVQPGEVKSLKKMLEALKVKAILVKGALGRELVALADSIDKYDQQSGYVDLLLRKDDGWMGYNTLWRAALKTLESKFGGGESGGKPLERRNVLVLGNGGVARSLAYAVGQRKGLVSVCGPDDKETQKVAAELGCRFVPFQNLFDTLTDAIIIGDARLVAGQKQGNINPSLFKGKEYVVDASDPPVENSLYTEAKDRGSKLVSPVEIFYEQTRAQFKALTGKDLPESALAESGLE